MLKSFETIAENGVIRLPAGAPSTAHCVVTILDDDPATLRQQADFVFPEAKQQRMSELLDRNRADELTPDESSELDALSEEFDTATLTKGRALAALAQLRPI
jgi:hypothetical protein